MLHCLSLYVAFCCVSLSLFCQPLLHQIKLCGYRVLMHRGKLRNLKGFSRCEKSQKMTVVMECRGIPLIGHGIFNPLIATLKLQSNRPPYSNGDWYTGYWWVGCYMWHSEEGTGWGHSLPRPLLTVPNVTSHPSTASVPTSYYSMQHYNCLWSLKG